MKLILTGMVGTVLAAKVFAAPTILENSATVVQPISGKVDISYVLPGPDPAVVTIDIQKNEGGEWVSIGDERVRTLSGEVNKVVAPSANARTVRWDAATDWPRQKIADGKVRAVVEAWPTNAPPPYMVVGLENASVRFYRSEEALPHLLTDQKMKTEYLALRKVPAANVTWTMGKVGADGSDTSVQPARTVTLTEDYYLGVYPLTQGQLEKFDAGASTSFAPTYSYGKGNGFPVYNLSYDTYRGSKSAGYDWPNNPPLHAVAPNSFLGKLRAHVGQGLEFDLPTEAQWEFACRAGTTGPWNVPEDASACYLNENSTCAVGYSRNAWGFYDMHGNVGNFCLEYFAAYDPGEHVDPKGAVNDTGNAGLRVYRGGYYCEGQSNREKFSSSYGRYRGKANEASRVCGIRLCCPPVVALPRASGRLVLTFDDQSSVSSWLAARETFRKYDAHATFFVNGTYGEAVLANMKTLAGDGHSLGFHSCSNERVTDRLALLGAEQMIAADLAPEKTAAQSAGLSMSSFAYPSSARNAMTDQILLEEVSRLRSGQLSGRDPEAAPLKNESSAFISAADTKTAKVIVASCIISQSDACVRDICEALERAAANDETLPLYAHAIEASGDKAADAHNVTVPQLERILATARELNMAIVGFDEL